MSNTNPRPRYELLDMDGSYSIIKRSPIRGTYGVYLEGVQSSIEASKLCRFLNNEDKETGEKTDD